jgi:hypothetical protein
LRALCALIVQLGNRVALQTVEVIEGVAAG